jgi:hypothetical protein
MYDGYHRLSGLTRIALCLIVAGIISGLVPISYSFDYFGAAQTVDCGSVFAPRSGRANSAICEGLRSGRQQLMWVLLAFGAGLGALEHRRQKPAEKSGRKMPTVWTLHTSDTYPVNGNAKHHGVYKSKEVVQAAVSELFPELEIRWDLIGEDEISGALSRPDSHPHLYFTAKAETVITRVPGQRNRWMARR